jgi:hypothetical protein
MKSSALSLALVCVTVSTLQAEVDRRGTTAANFLLFQPGAASTALGGAGISLALDATSFWWNPATLSTYKNAISSYSTSSYWADVDFHYTSLILPMTDQFSMGLALDFVPIGDMERTTLTQPDGTGESFDAENLALVLGMAWQLTNRIHVGASVKYIQERIWLEEATGVAIDVGSYFHLEDAGVSFGMALSNFGPDMQMSGPHLTYYDDPEEYLPGSQDRPVQLMTEEYVLPSAFRMGFTIDLLARKSLFFRNPMHRLSLSTSMEDRVDAPFRTQLGLTYAWNRAVFLRGGVRGNHDTARVSLGTGVLVPIQDAWLLGCDFSWTDHQDLGDVIQWTLSLQSAKQ